MPGVAAGVLDDAVHPDRDAVRDERGRPSVLERAGGHEVVHLQREVVVEVDDRRHALAHGDGLPRGVVVELHEGPVAEHAPLAPVDRGGVERRVLVLETPQAAAAAAGRARGGRFMGPAAGADEHHGRLLPHPQMRPMPRLSSHGVTCWAYSTYSARLLRRK